MTLLRPCLECGEPSEDNRCVEHRANERTRKASNRERRTNTGKWQRFSRRLRRLSPFCEKCGTTEQLSVDHIIPFSQRPDLEYVVANCRILCLTCNGQRGDNVTDDERAEVLARLDDQGRHPARTDARTPGKPQTQMRMVPNKGVCDD